MGTTISTSEQEECVKDAAECEEAHDEEVEEGADEVAFPSSAVVSRNGRVRGR
jgi:hypothetical protein